MRINQIGIDNSFSWDKHDLLRFGKGGVDDAEDAEVILHEYGHAIQDSQRLRGFGTSVEAGSIGEGFGDYWAVTVRNVIAPTPDAPCVADWDSVSYTSTVPHCLRRIDPTSTTRGSERPGPPRRADLVARAVGYPPGARERQGRHDHSGGAVRLCPGHVDARGGRPNRRCRAAAVRRAAANTVQTAFQNRGIL